jgi:hypothetical protein
MLSISILVLALGCDATHMRGGAAFASASGASASGKPFALLRFTPSDRGQSIAGTSVKRHPSGDLVIAGVFDGQADVGAGTARLNGGATAFVGRYSPSGHARWIKWMSTADYDGPRVAVDASGDVFVVASSRFEPTAFGTLEPACKETSGCPFGSAIHVLSADGQLRWSRRLHARDSREAMTAKLVDVDSSGDVTIAGRFGGASDGFVARYASATGDRRWFTRLRTKGAATFDGLAVAGGDAVLTGQVTGELGIDDQQIVDRGGIAPFAIRLKREDGASRWMKRVGNASSQGNGLAIAADTTGDVFVVMRERSASDTADRATVQKLVGATGEPRWSQSIQRREGEVRGAAIDMAEGTTPVIAFKLASSLSPQTAAVVVALSNENGEAAWSRQLRTYDAKAEWAVDASSLASVGPSEVIVTGWFTGRADLGGSIGESPWGRDRKRCSIDDDDDACRTDWAARAMFVARVSPH